MIDNAPDPVSRILVIDDNRAIHQDLRKILEVDTTRSAHSDAERALFGPEEFVESRNFQVDSAYQGEEGLALVQWALQEQVPYALAFIDVRMPPGWDGIETTSRIWEVDPDIQIVICTAYSDYSWKEMIGKLGRSDRLMILKKPFDTIEAVQLATALTEKWRLSRLTCSMMTNLEDLVTQRTAAMEQARDQLAVSEAHYRLLFYSNPHPMWVYDLKTLRVFAANDAAVANYGYTREQFKELTMLDLQPAQASASDSDRAASSIATAGTNDVYWHRKSNGANIQVQVSAHPIEFMGRHASVVLAYDVTERFEQERKIARLSRIRAMMGGISSAMLRLRDRNELLQEACRVAGAEGGFPMAWVGVIDPSTQQGHVIASVGGSHEYLETSQFSALPDSPLRDRPSSCVAREGTTYICNDIQSDHAVRQSRVELQKLGYGAGAVFPLRVGENVVGLFALAATEMGFFDRDEIALLEGLVADISYALDHIEKSNRLDFLAYYDAITGLPNARLFRDRLEQFIQTARQEQGEVCLVMIDLQDFTQINDNLGRSSGDALLRQIGMRLQQRLVSPYALARIGSDTFALASPRGGSEIATALRDEMLAALEQPFSAQGTELFISAQAGIAFFAIDGDDAASVFNSAETALKLAKTTGQRYCYYSSEMSAQIAQRQALALRLRAAIDKEELSLHFLSRVDMISGEVVGAEALIRWQHPDGLAVTPSQLIATAEQNGLIVPIGAWVIDTVCAYQSAWIAAGLGVVPIAINLSSVQFEQCDMLALVRDALTRHCLEAKYLDLELTESTVMRDPQEAAKTLQALRKLGVGLALDDFGTGYSSLSHLRQLPFNAVKIDRDFIGNITHNAGDAAIATAIISMAHRLNLKVVAEGVETQAQFDYLRRHGCDEMQGHLFSAAVPKEEFESQLRSGLRKLLPTSEPTNQRTLLLVDDEPSVMSALSRLLRRDGYRILTAASGHEGLELLALHSVQVIVSDERMPGMSGIAFLDTAKQMYPDTMRIILSGAYDIKLVTESINRGAVFKFLTKPWNDELLRELVRDAFRRYRPELSTEVNAVRPLELIEDTAPMPSLTTH